MIGVLLPYLARIPGAWVRGPGWFTSYLPNWWGVLFFGAFNAVAWGSLLGASFLLQKPPSLLLPAALGFGFLAFAHGVVDLGADAQAAIALVFIPIYAVPLIGIGTAVAAWLERRRG
jgi:hypothetical protein